MLTREQLRGECLAQAGAELDYPFGADVMVFKVMGRMFALVPETGAVSISLKCEPMLGEILCSTYAAVTPGYHLNKRHWISVAIDGSVPDDDVLDWIVQSYRLVVGGLTKGQRAALQGDA